MNSFSESVVKGAALSWLGALGHTVLQGPDITAGEAVAERGDPNYREVLLERWDWTAVKYIGRND